MRDVKKIKFKEVEYEINVDQLQGIPEVIAEYLMSNRVTVLLEGRYQVDGGNPDAGDQPAWRLLDWKILTVSLDGQVLDHDERVPSDFPMALVINSTYSRHTREYLEARPPEMYE
jgi:hypothetical protein